MGDNNSRHISEYIVASCKVLMDKISRFMKNDKTNTNNDNTPKVMRLEPPSFTKQLAILYNGPSKIDDGIYLGSAIDSASYYNLKSLGIKYIINMTEEVSFYYPDDFEYMRYPMLDNNDMPIQPYLEEIYGKIERIKTKNDGGILVHCMMGASRSATVILYYLMKKKNINVNDAINELKKMRNGINITMRFYRDLFNEQLEKIDKKTG